MYIYSLLHWNTTKYKHNQIEVEQTHYRVVYEKKTFKNKFFLKKELSLMLIFSITLRFVVSATLFHLTCLSDKSHARNGNTRFSGLRKSILRRMLST